MKKTHVAFIAFLLILSMIFSSCSSNPAASDIETTPPAADTTASTEFPIDTTSAPEEDTTETDAPLSETDKLLMEIEPHLTSKLTVSAVNSLPIATASMTKDQLRQLCLDYFELQLSFQWLPNISVTDYPTTYSSNLKTIDLGSVYTGIPYQSYGTGNLYRWLEYYNENTGVFDIIKAFSENGGEYNTAYEYDSAGNISYYKRYCMMIFFNQCSVASFWGWGKVINSANFQWTSEMNVYNGFIPVGDYTYGYTHNGKYYGPETIDSFGEKTANNPKAYDTKNVIADWTAANGAVAMFKCYAQLRPADLVVSGGHAMMIKQVSPYYNADGTLDPDKSYVLVLEQTEGWKSKSVPTGALDHKMQGRVDNKYTFTKLQSSKYIPFTFAEFLEEDDPRLSTYSSSVMSCYTTFADLVKGKTGIGLERSEIYCTNESGKDISLAEFKELVVGSNYSISDVFVNIKDANGNVVHTNTYRADSARIREVSMTAQHCSWENARTISYKLNNYATGEYTVEVSLQLSTGEKPVAFVGTLVSD